MRAVKHRHAPVLGVNSIAYTRLVLFSLHTNYSIVLSRSFRSIQVPFGSCRLQNCRGHQERRQVRQKA